jgi:hypothetical protein
MEDNQFTYYDNKIKAEVTFNFNELFQVYSVELIYLNPQDVSNYFNLTTSSISQEERIDGRVQDSRHKK